MVHFRARLARAHAVAGRPVLGAARPHAHIRMHDHDMAREYSSTRARDIDTRARYVYFVWALGAVRAYGQS